MGALSYKIDSLTTHRWGNYCLAERSAPIVGQRCPNRDVMKTMGHISMAILLWRLAPAYPQSNCELLGETFDYYSKQAENPELDGEKRRPFLVAQYLTMRFLHDSECVKAFDPGSDSPSADCDRNWPQAKFLGEGDPLMKLLMGNAPIILRMEKDIYQDFYRGNRNEQLKLLQQTVCDDRPEEEDSFRDGVDYFCQRIGELLEDEQQELAHWEEYDCTFMRFLGGGCGQVERRELPGAHRAISSGIQIGFGYLARSAQISWTKDRGALWAQQYERLKAFRRTNCIGQQPAFDIKWNFLDSSGNILSTDGNPVRSDLSNWDMQRAGNFSSCNPQTFVSPFSVRQTAWPI